MDTNFVLPSFKAFGDFVIARHCHRSSNNISSQWLIGSHLEELNEIFHTYDRSTIIKTKKNLTPAIYDFKNSGIINSLESIIYLRNQILKLNFSDRNFFVVDKLGFREQLLYKGFSILELPKSQNIYQSYYDLFGATPCFANATPTPKFRKIYIFPFSRVQRKNIPVSILNNILKILLAYDINVSLVLLEGEHAPVGLQKVDILIIKKNFQSLSNAISSSCGVISADSLPCHIAEFHSVPSFVCSPQLNTYWLPYSTYLKMFTSTFNFSKLDTYNFERFIKSFY